MPRGHACAVFAAQNHLAGANRCMTFAQGCPVVQEQVSESSSKLTSLTRALPCRHFLLKNISLERDFDQQVAEEGKRLPQGMAVWKAQTVGNVQSLPDLMMLASKLSTSTGPVNGSCAIMSKGCWQTRRLEIPDDLGAPSARRVG